VALIKKATEDREDKKKGIKVKGISMSWTKKPDKWPSEHDIIYLSRVQVNVPLNTFGVRVQFIQRRYQ
jgi:hypothetical protein